MNRGIVAPFTGAWIEINGHIYAEDIEQMSHPLRVRGLKFSSSLIPSIFITSHPLRVRGLKLFYPCLYNFTVFVAPFTGAWIEMCKHKHLRCLNVCRTLYGCVD